MYRIICHSYDVTETSANGGVRIQASKSNIFKLITIITIAAQNSKIGPLLFFLKQGPTMSQGA